MVNQNTETSDARRPNIVFILADDQGGVGTGQRGQPRGADPQPGSHRAGGDTSTTSSVRPRSTAGARLDSHGAVSPRGTGSMTGCGRGT